MSFLETNLSEQSLGGLIVIFNVTKWSQADGGQLFRDRLDAKCSTTLTSPVRLRHQQTDRAVPAEFHEFFGIEQK